MDKNKKCCDVVENMIVYTDARRNKYQQCKICGRIIKPILET